MTKSHRSEPGVLDVMEQTNAAFLRLLDMRKGMDPTEWRSLARDVLKRATTLAEQVREQIIATDPNEHCVFCDRLRFDHPATSHGFTSFYEYKRGENRCP